MFTPNLSKMRWLKMMVLYGTRFIIRVTGIHMERKIKTIKH